MLEVGDLTCLTAVGPDHPHLHPAVGVLVTAQKSNAFAVAGKRRTAVESIAERKLQGLGPGVKQIDRSFKHCMRQVLEKLVNTIIVVFQWMAPELSGLVRMPILILEKQGMMRRSKNQE